MGKILIVAPSWVGDLVMSQPLFQLLKQQDPSNTLTVLAPSYLHPLLARMPAVDTIKNLPFRHGEFNIKQRWQLAKALRTEQYTQALVIPNSWKSALIPWLARIPQRTAWLGEQRYGLLNDWRKLDKNRYPLMLQRLIALGLPAKATLPDPLPQPTLTINATDCQHTLMRYQLNTDKPILALCPGAQFGPAKQWPAEHFASVANMYLQHGGQVWLFGANADQSICREIQQLTNNRCQDLSGNTNLGEAIDLLSLSAAVISNDSGLMHIAAALQRPMIAVYGSSSPDFTPPLSTLATVLSLKLACSPCFQRTCPLGHLNCLKQLYPAQVIATLTAKQLLPGKENL